MAIIRRIVDEYPYVAMDTEFPGVVARPVGKFQSSGEYHYQMLRCVLPVSGLGTPCTRLTACAYRRVTGNICCLGGAGLGILRHGVECALSNRSHAFLCCVRADATWTC